MILSPTYLELIIYIENKVKEILENGGDEIEVCLAMLEKMPEIKSLILSNHQKKLQMYLSEYKGFCYYMKSLEKMSERNNE